MINLKLSSYFKGFCYTYQKSVIKAFVFLNVCYTGVGIYFVRSCVTLGFISIASATCDA